MNHSRITHTQKFNDQTMEQHYFIVIEAKYTPNQNNPGRKTALQSV